MLSELPSFCVVRVSPSWLEIAACMRLLLALSPRRSLISFLRDFFSLMKGQPLKVRPSFLNSLQSPPPVLLNAFIVGRWLESDSRTGLQTSLVESTTIFQLSWLETNKLFLCLIFMCLCIVYTCECRAHQRPEASGLLALWLQAVVSCLTWVQERKWGPLSKQCVLLTSGPALLPSLWVLYLRLQLHLRHEHWKITCWRSK